MSALKYLNDFTIKILQPAYSTRKTFHSTAGFKDDRLEVRVLLYRWSLFQIYCNELVSHRWVQRPYDSGPTKTALVVVSFSEFLLVVPQFHSSICFSFQLILELLSLGHLCSRDMHVNRRSWSWSPIYFCDSVVYDHPYLTPVKFFISSKRLGTTSCLIPSWWGFYLVSVIRFANKYFANLKK